jgi:hypothetical protein
MNILYQSVYYRFGRFALAAETAANVAVFRIYAKKIPEKK